MDYLGIRPYLDDALNTHMRSLGFITPRLDFAFIYRNIKETMAAYIDIPVEQVKHWSNQKEFLEPIHRMPTDWLRSPPLVDSVKNHDPRACFQARIDVFRDKQLRSILTNEVFFEMRQLWADLQPWSLGQTMFDANPQLRVYIRDLPPKVHDARFCD